jgi:hypothetical protein
MLKKLFYDKINDGLRNENLILGFWAKNWLLLFFIYFNNGLRNNANDKQIRLLEH